MRAVIIVLALSVTACGGNWREVTQYTGTLRCGMTIEDARNEALTRRAERFQVTRSREGFAEYLTGTSRTHVLLTFSASGLHEYRAVRFFGLTGVETLAEATLCSNSPQSIIEYKVEAPAEYAGADVTIRGSSVGRLTATSVPSAMSVGFFEAETGPALVKIEKDGQPTLTKEMNVAWDAQWAFVDVRPCP